MNTKHTAGPWAIMPAFPLVVVRADQAHLSLGASSDVDADRRDYAQEIASVPCEDISGYPTFTHRRHNQDQAKADARLIAAAPELLAACQSIAALADGQGRANMMMVASQARAAIAKAQSTTKE